MIDDQLSGIEAADFGTRLEAVCRQFSLREQEFLKTALWLAATDLWARSTGPLPQRSIRELVLDIQLAGAADAISLNPLPIPLNSKGPTV